MAYTQEGYAKGTAVDAVTKKERVVESITEVARSLLQEIYEARELTREVRGRLLGKYDNECNDEGPVTAPDSELQTLHRLLSDAKEAIGDVRRGLADLDTI